MRARIVGFMADHEEEFAPFVEDDESFGSYVARMKKVRHGESDGGGVGEMGWRRQNTPIPYRTKR